MKLDSDILLEEGDVMGALKVHIPGLAQYRCEWDGIACLQSAVTVQIKLMVYWSVIGLLPTSWRAKGDHARAVLVLVRREARALLVVRSFEAVVPGVVASIAAPVLDGARGNGAPVRRRTGAPGGVAGIRSVVVCD